MTRHGWLLSAMLLAGCEHPPPAPPAEAAEAAGQARQAEQGAAPVSEAPSPVVTPPQPAQGRPPGQAGACLLPEASGAREGQQGSGAAEHGPRGWVSVEGKAGQRPPRLPDRLIKGKLLRCYAAALRERPELSGELSFSLLVGPRGQVLEVDLITEGDHLGGVRDCMQNALKRLVFEPPQGGSARVEGRIVLRPTPERRGAASGDR